MVTPAGLSYSPGCGSTTFTAAASNSGTSTATLILTAATATLSAGHKCTVTVATGITTSPLSQATDLAARTVAVGLAAAKNIAATAILKSTAVVYPTAGLANSALEIGSPYSAAPTSIKYNFALNVPMQIDDTVALALPHFTFGSLATPSKVGCGTTTFQATSASSGVAGATLTLTAKTADMDPFVHCFVTVATGVTTGTTPQSEDFASVTVTLA
jgi:hypothetical protein